MVLIIDKYDNKFWDFFDNIGCVRTCVTWNILGAIVKKFSDFIFFFF